MNLEEFKKLHRKFSKKSLPKGIWETPEYFEYCTAIAESEECGNWYLEQKLSKRKFDCSNYCCLKMAFRVSEGVKRTGKIIYNNVDVIMCKWEDDTYGIPIHDGGSSIISINYCPWYGKKLQD